MTKLVTPSRDDARGYGWPLLLKIMLTGLAATVVVVLILVPAGSFLSGRPARAWTIAFVYGFAYALTNGALAWLTVPYVERLVRRRKHAQKWTILILAFILLPVLGSLAAGVILAAAGMFPWSQYWQRFVGSYQIGVVISILAGSGWFVYESLQYRVEAVELRARLTSLESRLQPHFLFNTLNSISALIPEDPAAAERMTERLAALLRFSLDSTARDVIPLEEELKIVGDYLEIERTRYGPRLSYAIEVFEQPENPHVPPFSIQTLVENSVKHGGPDIRVTVQAECGRLAVDVWDSGDGFDESAIQPGHALDNLRSRLAALWGSAASLAISRGARGNTVRLSVPITSK